MEQCDSLNSLRSEPTLHRELLPMIEHACGRGMRVNISSNGRAPDQLAEIMAEIKQVLAQGRDA